MRRPIVNNSRPGQAIYDPFLGSGTSLIAAEMTGRVCYGLELSPAYVDVIVRRWQTLHRAHRDASSLRSIVRRARRPARTEIDQEPPMARKAFVVNEAMREKVRHLAGVGVRQDDIARIIGCAPKTLRKRFRDELDRGVAEANATVSGYLFAAAKARQCHGADLLAEDAGALAREGGAGRPGSGQRRRGAIHRWSSSCPTTAEIPS